MQSRSDRPYIAMSLAESQVMAALKRLPPRYKVTVGGRSVRLSDSWNGGTSISYEPDFMVVNETGARIMIEVKSQSALSLANMVRLVAIDQAIRATGDGFILIVPAGSGITSRALEMPEFKSLHIYIVSSPNDVIGAIESEFVDMLKPA